MENYKVDPRPLGRLLQKAVEFSKPIYYRFFKKPSDAWNLQAKDLIQYEEGSLGKELYYFLQSEGFDLMPCFEEHDVMHVLLNYSTAVEDEIAMQFFLLGNGKKSAYALLAALAGTLLMPQNTPHCIKAFKRGRNARKITLWNFNHLLHEPINELRSVCFRCERDYGYNLVL